VVSLCLHLASASSTGYPCSLSPTTPGHSRIGSLGWFECADCYYCTVQHVRYVIVDWSSKVHYKVGSGGCKVGKYWFLAQIRVMVPRSRRCMVLVQFSEAEDACLTWYSCCASSHSRVVRRSKKGAGAVVEEVQEVQLPFPPRGNHDTQWMGLSRCHLLSLALPLAVQYCTIQTVLFKNEEHFCLAGCSAILCNYRGSNYRSTMVIFFTCLL
jgi:hypothetical protein